MGHKIDIRKLTEDEARQRLAQIVESSNDAIISTTCDGIVESWNAAAEKLFGYTCDEAIGQPILTLFVPPEYDEEVRRKLNANSQGQHMEPVDTVRRHKDGSLVNVSVMGSPIIDKMDKAIGVSIVFRDISKRKADEAKIRLFRELLDHSNDAIEVLDPVTLRFVDVNETQCQVLGYSREELLSMDILDIDSHFTEDNIRILKEQIIQFGGAQFETVHRRKDGTTFPVEVSVKLVELEKTYLVCIVSDITERKRALSRLQQSEISLKDAQRIAHMGNWELDLTTDVLQWSDEVYRILELDPEKTKPSYEAFLKSVHPKDKEKVDLAYADSLKTKQPYIFEFRLLMKDGRIKHVQEICQTTFDQAGNPLYSIGTTLDITERKIIEKKLARHMQLYAALSQCNKAIVQCTNKEELFSQVCRAAVQFGGMKMAWVGIVDPQTHVIQPVVSFGDDRGYLTDLKISTDASNPHGVAPTSTAIREGRPYWCQNLLNDSATTPWRKMISTAGCAASASLPLRRNGVVIGAFVLYCDEVNAFDELIQDLLVEMATDISFALDSFAYEAQRGESEEQIKQFEAIVHSSNDAIISKTVEGIITSWNPGAENVFGYSAEEAIGKSIKIILPPDRLDEEDLILEKIKRGERVEHFETKRLRKDGAIIDTSITLSPILDHAGNSIGTSKIARNITERKLAESEKKRAEEKALGYMEQLRDSLNGTIEMVEILSEMRDPYTAGHERRVALLAVDLAAGLGLDAHQLEGIRVAGNLHDVGKMMVPAEILSRPSKLSPVEYAMVQGHVQAGFNVLKGIHFPWPVAQAVLQHHERMDGSGYPQGLKGEEIILEARILAVADVVEAMSAHRPYRPGLGINAALEEIERYRGIKYDAKVVDMCLQLFREQGYSIPIKVVG